MKDDEMDVACTASVAISPQANYTDWETAVAGEASVDSYRQRVLCGQTNLSLRLLISVF